MAIGVIGGRTSASSALLILMASTPLWADEPMTGYPVEPISFEKVQLADEFWLPRLRTQRRVLVPFAFEQTSKALHDHELAARVIAGGDPRRLPG